MSDQTAVIDNDQVNETDVPATEPATEEIAQVASSVDDRYPAKETAQALGARLADAHELGWTRPKITELVARVRRLEVEGEGDCYTLAVGDEVGDGFKMGGSALWRSRAGRVHAAEVPYLTAVLDAIEVGDVSLPERPTKDAGKLRDVVLGHQASLEAIAELASGSVDVRGVGGLREVLASILDVATNGVPTADQGISADDAGEGVEG